MVLEKGAKAKTAFITPHIQGWVQNQTQIKVWDGFWTPGSGMSVSLMSLSNFLVIQVCQEVNAQ